MSYDLREFVTVFQINWNNFYKASFFLGGGGGSILTKANTHILPSLNLMIEYYILYCPHYTCGLANFIICHSHTVI